MTWQKKLVLHFQPFLLSACVWDNPVISSKHQESAQPVWYFPALLLLRCHQVKKDWQASYLRLQERAPKKQVKLLIRVIALFFPFRYKKHSTRKAYHTLKELSSSYLAYFLVVPSLPQAGYILDATDWHPLPWIFKVQPPKQPIICFIKTQNHKVHLSHQHNQAWTTCIRKKTFPSQLNGSN